MTCGQCFSLNFLSGWFHKIFLEIEVQAAGDIKMKTNVTGGKCNLIFLVLLTPFGSVTMKLPFKIDKHV